jgi:hypothetical protein
VLRLSEEEMKIITSFLLSLLMLVTPALAAAPNTYERQMFTNYGFPVLMRKTPTPVKLVHKSTDHGKDSNGNPTDLDDFNDDNGDPNGIYLLAVTTYQADLGTPTYDILKQIAKGFGEGKDKVGDILETHAGRYDEQLAVMFVLTEDLGNGKTEEFNTMLTYKGNRLFVWQVSTDDTEAGLLFLDSFRFEKE